MSAPSLAPRTGPLGSGPVGRAATVAIAVLAVDMASKSLALALLGARTVPLPLGGFLRVVYNDGFARGPSLGALTLPATLLLAAALLYMMARVCAPLAEHDRTAPLALGLVAGAAMGNAADLFLTARGVVDFLGVRTGREAIVFNLADVAAYAGVVLLARTLWILGRLAWAERASRARREPAPRYPRLHAAAEAAWAAHKAASARPMLEIVRPVPLYTEGGSTTGPATPGIPTPGQLPDAAEAAAPRLTLVRGRPTH